MTSRIINHHGNVEEVSAPAFTEGPWFVHDFRGASSNPTVRDITVSCDHPATITVCSMDRALTAEPEEALANARLISAAPDGFDAGEEAIAALNAMMDAWFDYHDNHSLTQPVTGAAGNAFDKALAAREKLEAFIAKALGEQQ